MRLTDEAKLYNEHNWDSKCVCIDCEEYRDAWRKQVGKTEYVRWQNE